MPARRPRSILSAALVLAALLWLALALPPATAHGTLERSDTPLRRGRTRRERSLLLRRGSGRTHRAGWLRAGAARAGHRGRARGGFPRSHRAGGGELVPRRRNGFGAGGG